MAEFPLSAADLTRIASGAAIGALAAVVSGCLFFDPPSRESVLEESITEHTTIPENFGSGHEKGEVADDWLASFDDPDMRAIVEEAIAHNIDLRQAAAVVEIARQNVAVVSAALWPHLGVKMSATRTKDYDTSGHYSSQGAYGVISWEIDVWGQLRAERQAAQADFETTALDYAYARQSLAATTAKSWYLAVEMRQIAEIAAEAVDIYREVSKLVAERRAAGRVADLDVAEANSSLNAAQASLRAARSMELRARRALQLLLGRYPDAQIATAPEFPPPPPPVEAGLPSSLLERRPDLVAAEQGVLAAFRTHEAAELALLPQFTFSLDGGRLDDGILSLLELNPWLIHGSIGMYLPIWEGGANFARIRIADAGQTQAVAAYGSAVLRAFAEVETLLSDEVLLGEQLHFQQLSLEDRSEAVRIARTQYLAGKSDLLSVLQLQNDQLRARQDVIELSNAQLANRIDLHLAVGGSFDATPAATIPPPAEESSEESSEATSEKTSKKTSQAQTESASGGTR